MTVCKKSLDSLTALKGLFCLVIAIHNTLAIHFVFDHIPGTSFILYFGGIMGNSLFLMISGFLFAYNYRDRIQARQVPFHNFLLRRLQKLYPLYLITNGIALLIDVSQYGPSAINLTRIVSILLLQSYDPYNSPTWFLAALFLCYLLFFAISYHSKNRTQYCCAITLCMILGFVLDTDLPFLGSKNCFAYMSFFAGCLLAEGYPLIAEKKRKVLPHICVLMLMGIGYLFLKYGVQVISGDIETAFTFLISPALLYLALAEGIYSRILQFRPLVFLGKISTSIYFWHLPLFHILCNLLPGEEIQETQYLFYLLLLIIFSVFSRKYIENAGTPSAK